MLYGSPVDSAIPWIHCRTVLRKTEAEVANLDAPPLEERRTGDAAGHPCGFGDGPAHCETIGSMVKWYIIVRGAAYE